MQIIVQEGGLLIYSKGLTSLFADGYTFFAFGEVPVGRPFFGGVSRLESAENTGIQVLHVPQSVPLLINEVDQRLDPQLFSHGQPHGVPLVSEASSLLHATSSLAENASILEDFLMDVGFDQQPIDSTLQVILTLASGDKIDYKDSDIVFAIETEGQDNSSPGLCTLLTSNEQTCLGSFVILQKNVHKTPGSLNYLVETEVKLPVAVRLAGFNTDILHSLAKINLSQISDYSSPEHVNQLFNKPFGRPGLRLYNFGGSKKIGLITTVPIKKGDSVCEYIGEHHVFYLENDYLPFLTTTMDSMPYLLTLGISKDKKRLHCLDAGEQGSIARFINHSTTPNLIYAVPQVTNEGLKVMVTALLDIEPFTELCTCYGEGYEDFI